MRTSNQNFLNLKKTGIITCVADYTYGQCDIPIFVTGMVNTVLLTNKLNYLNATSLHQRVMSLYLQASKERQDHQFSLHLDTGLGMLTELLYAQWIEVTNTGVEYLLCSFCQEVRDIQSILKTKDNEQDIL